MPQTSGVLTRPDLSPEVRLWTHGWWANGPHGTSQLGLWMDPGLERRVGPQWLWSEGPVDPAPHQRSVGSVLGRGKGLESGEGGGALEAERRSGEGRRL